MLKSIEDAILSENFWNVAVPQNLTMASTNNPTYLVYLAAQVYFNDISMLSTNITVRELIHLGGDVHHVFPKQYLINHNYAKSQYNQDANYAYLDRPVKELKGFKKVFLKAGEEKEIAVKLSKNAFTVVNDEGERKSGSGKYAVYCGFNQPDKRSEALTGKKCVKL
jgi:hypothetical protein